MVNCWTFGLRDLARVPSEKTIMEKLCHNHMFAAIAGTLLTLCSATAQSQQNSCAAIDGSGHASQWVHVDSQGNLVYKNLPSGDHIMDFSSAGFMGGGVALPNVPVKIRVAAAAGDNTAAIQAAIDSVSSMPLQNGVRGAVLLGTGNFNVSGALKIAASGVVLRGSGSGTNGTVIHMTGTPHDFLDVQGSGSP